VPAGDRRWIRSVGWIVITLAAFILAVVVLALHPVGDYYAESDFYGGYADGARLIQHRHLDPARYTVVGPVYEIAVALAGLATRDLYLAGKLVSALAALGTIVLWWALLSRRAGEVSGLGALLFLAANPIFLRLGASASTDMLATFVQSASIFATLEGRGRWAPVLAGSLAALAIFTRYNSVYLLPAAVLCYTWLAPARGLGRGRAIGLYLAGCAGLSAPWIAWSVAHGVTPGAVPVRSFGFYWAPDASRNIQDLFHAPGESGPSYPSFLTLLRQSPAQFLGRLLGNVPEHLRLDAIRLLGLPSALFCAVGLTLALRSAGSRRLVPIWLFGGLLFLTLVPAFPSERYSLPLAPFYLSFAGLAFGSDRLAALAKHSPVPLPALIALIPLALTIRDSAALERRVREQLPVEVVAAGRTLAAAAGPGDRVMSRKGHIGYYSGLEVEEFPRLATLRELGDFARARRCAFLYYSWYESLLRPEFSYLLDTTAAVPGLTAIFASGENPAVLYRIGADFGRDPSWISDDFARALHVARAMVRVLPDSLAWRHRTVLAVEALALGRDEQARSLAEAALRAHPADSLGWTVLGEAERGLGRYSRAVDAYRHALALDPQDLQARVGLGWALLQSGRREEAAAAWRPALGHTHDAASLAAMSRLFRSLGDADHAKAAEQALRPPEVP
jgi:tetratricopeptide (TPR) repeat protein